MINRRVAPPLPPGFVCKPLHLLARIAFPGNCAHAS